MSLGDIYLRINDFDNALIVFKHALSKGRYQAYGKIGNIYYSKGKNTAI